MRFQLFTLLFSAALASSAGEDTRVQITPTLARVPVHHNGQRIVIEREQNPDATINPVYAKTARDCPPFCVQPAKIAPGVETIGELEVLNYLTAIEDGDDSVMVIDSRTPAWLTEGTIPGSVNIPWTTLSPEAGADPMTIVDILEERFGALAQEGLWNFAAAKTLVLFCNGMWCGQSPSNIRTLLNFGYPAHKIKWYRGGMQSWEALGLTTVK